MRDSLSVVALFALAVVVSTTLTPLTVVGQSSLSGEIRLAPSDASLEEGETKTIEINYDSLSADNPKGIKFTLNYDPDVISVVDANKGGYLGAGAAGTGPTTTSGEVAFGYTQVNPVDADSGTVATITIELADGVSQGDTTDLTFTEAGTIGTVTSPQRVDGTVEAIESTDEAPQGPDYNVQVVNPTLSPTTIDDSSGTHILEFDIAEVSADNEHDNVTVTLPDSVAVEDITNTTITNSNEEEVQLVGDDPTTLSDPGNEINLTVNPIGATDTQTLTVEMEMRLSAAS